MFGNHKPRPEQLRRAQRILPRVAALLLQQHPLRRHPEIHQQIPHGAGLRIDLVHTQDAAAASDDPLRLTGMEQPRRGPDAIRALAQVRAITRAQIRPYPAPQHDNGVRGGQRLSGLGGKGPLQRPQHRIAGHRQRPIPEPARAQTPRTG
jgi:hypothetical protein